MSIKGKKYKNYILTKIKNFKYSIINVLYLKSKIAIFLLPPENNPNSGGYRTLLKYINYLNNIGYSLDIYFGVCWNKTDIHLNVNKLDNNGIPCCSNWLNKNYTEIIYELIKNIKKYNEIDINKNNFYIGLRCQRNYKILIANAWQVANAVYLNKDRAEYLYYIIQDREELFYPNNINIRKNVINTYKNSFYYYCISQYLGYYFKKKYKLNNIMSSYMGVKLETYKNLYIIRENSVIIPYYKDIKPGRKPKLVKKIIDILSNNNIKCYIYPFNYEKNNINIINLGILKEEQLNNLYNKCKVGIVFSNTNPSRLGFEMYASGLNVIEYDSEFTKYDLPNKYFTKIKDESNILKIVNELFNKPYDNSFLQNIDINRDFKNFEKFINQHL